MDKATLSHFADVGVEHLPLCPPDKNKDGVLRVLRLDEAVGKVQKGAWETGIVRAQTVATECSAAWMRAVGSTVGIAYNDLQRMSHMLVKYVALQEDRGIEVKELDFIDWYLGQCRRRLKLRTRRLNNSASGN